MVRILAILSLVAALIAPHGAHARGGADMHVHDAHAAGMHHASDPCAGQDCEDAKAERCCDAIIGHCFSAVIDGNPMASDFAGAALASGSADAVALRSGLAIPQEPPPPRA